MLTYEYKPNKEKIKERSQMPMFGKTALSFTGKPCSSKLPAPKFHMQNEPQQKVDVYQYVPSFQTNTEYKPSANMPFTLHVFNIPKNIRKREFIDIVASKLETPIFYCHLVNDKEKGHFIGVAYLKFDTEEIARKAMKSLDGMQIGDCLIGVSVAKKQF
ncbi:putative Nucleotide-binding, alpha-beta plait, RNA recognition motif domain protein [Pseudoloma neurophilia]|uniref:Putative Nucleotide-binding, alpha-beta plait, RNA recognition motif domain protein n=1 Tax=Pseudoloma neurophilia TaxID=146866 RepID=A0A0R0M048_9MICR|nr:putative Nucleotide-binding, alpha-beta plait, RNA recognition motif domain protein [Pseudoloma neurophilia]